MFVLKSQVRACGTLENLTLKSLETTSCERPPPKFLGDEGETESLFASYREHLVKLDLCDSGLVNRVSHLHFPKLVEVILKDNIRHRIDGERITTDVMTHFLHNSGKMLQKLHLSGGFIGSDALINIITQECPRLRDFRLANSRPLLITDNGLKRMTRFMFHLERFSCLFSDHHLTTKGISSLASLARNHNLCRIDLTDMSSSAWPAMPVGAFPKSCIVSLNSPCIPKFVDAPPPSPPHW